MAQAQVFRITAARSPAQQRALRLLPLFMLLLMMLPLSLALLDGKDPVVILRRMLADTELLLIIGAVCILLPWSYKVDREYRRTARLYLDDWGIRLESSVHQWMVPSWKMAWDEIGSVRFFERYGLLRFNPKSFTGRPRGLQVFSWVEENEPDVAIDAGNVRGQTLWRALQTRNAFAAAGGGAFEDPASFDLAKHPATLTTLITGGALGGYGLLDNFVRGETYLADSFAFMIPPITVGLIAGIIAFLAMKKSRSPRPVPLLIAAALPLIWLGPGAGLASYSGLVRLGQIFGGPLLERPYHRDDSCTCLIAEDPALPPMIFSDWLGEYWCQFPKEKIILLPVREGLFGFYLVDQSVFADDIEAWRKTRRDQRRIDKTNAVKKAST